MLDIKGAFRVTKIAFVNIHYTVLLLDDSLLFVKTGSELNSSRAMSIEPEDLDRYKSMTEEQILDLDKKNYRIPHDEIIVLKLKKSGIGLNGARTGTFTVVTKGTQKFDIASFQDFKVIESMVRAVFPNKLVHDVIHATPESTAHISSEGMPMAEKMDSPGTADIGRNADFSKNDRTIRNGSFWLFAIAALSVVNFLLYFFGSSMNFIIGLGITQFLAGFAEASAGGLSITVTVVSFIFAGIFAFFGVFSRKGKTWAFILGIIIYGLDALIFLLVQDWFGIAFHALVLYFIIVGARAAFRSKKFRRI